MSYHSALCPGFEVLWRARRNEIAPVTISPSMLPTSHFPLDSLPQGPNHEAPVRQNLCKCREDTAAPAAISPWSHGTGKLALPHGVKACPDRAKRAGTDDCLEMLGPHERQFLMRVGDEVPIGLLKLEQLREDAITDFPIHPESQIIALARRVELKIDASYSGLPPLVQNLWNLIHRWPCNTERNEDLHV